MNPVDSTAVDERIHLYATAFAADPHHAYRQMRRRFGTLAPVELAPGVPATLVLGYYTALRILNDPDRFPADPRAWEHDVPADCPVLPLLQWRPNALRSAGFEHMRYRQVNTDAITKVNLHALHADVEHIATGLINSFCASGSADLVEHYAFPLAFEIVNTMIGCPPEIGERLAVGMMMIFEGRDAETGNSILTDALLELVVSKRSNPGDDIASRLIHHPTRLDDLELVHQLVVLYGAGIEPQQNLIVNTLLSILTDENFGGGLLGGSLYTRDALDHVLFTDPPMANFCISYPRQPMLLEHTWLPAHQPVVISMAACNNDPAISAGEHVGNRAHLAWSAGPHACPARPAAYQIAQDAIDQLLDALPEMQLRVPPDQLQWRPGPFHRALATLPVRFPASSPFTIPG